MTNQGGAYLVMAMSSIARILGMQADNSIRNFRGDSPAYDQSLFLVEAAKLDRLAIYLNGKAE